MIRATNHRLKVAREDKQKKEKIVEKRKIEVIAAKCCRNRRRISLSSKEEENYDSNTADNTDPDQTKGKYRVLRLNGGKAISK